MRISEFIKIFQTTKQFPYYTKQNLGLIFGKKGYNLDYLIKKLLQEKILIPLKKGVYSSSFYLEEIKEKGLYDLYLQQLANVLREPSYISLESALSYYGLIPEESFNITSITIKSSRIYKSPLTLFIYRNIKSNLFIGFNQKNETNPIQRATKAKALFDYLYLKKFNNKEEMEFFLEEKGRFNWFIFGKDDFKEFEQYVKISKSKKMAKIFRIINLLIK